MPENETKAEIIDFKSHQKGPLGKKKRFSRMIEKLGPGGQDTFNALAQAVLDDPETQKILED